MPELLQNILKIQNRNVVLQKNFISTVSVIVTSTGVLCPHSPFQSLARWRSKNYQYKWYANQLVDQHGEQYHFHLKTTVELAFKSF